MFFPNYRVSAMEIICPGTELSEQISTAGKEASGTGNMKFMMNGALTIGTLDGANIEIREKAGAENFFLFGLDAVEVMKIKEALRSQRDHRRGSRNRIASWSCSKSGHFNESEPGIFDVLTSGLRNPHDQWLTIADLRSYIDAQQEVNKTYPRPGDMESHEHLEYGQQRLVLQRPNDPAIRRRNLGRSAALRTWFEI